MDREEQEAALDALLGDRWSCRAYLPDEVPRETIERLLALAQRAASWSNTQPWRVDVTTTVAATERARIGLAAHRAEVGEGSSRPDYPMPSAYTGEHLERRRACGWQLYDAVGVVRGDRDGSRRQVEKNFAFFGAPHVTIVSVAAEQGVYGVLDAGLYVQAFLLAAHSLGLGAVAQAALAGYATFFREHFGIDDSHRVLLGISFGYPELPHPTASYRTARAPLDEVVTLHA